MNRKEFYRALRERDIKTNTVEYVYFLHVAWNLPNLHRMSNQALFKFSKLLNKGLMQTVRFENTFTKKQQKQKLAMGIVTGQVSVMRLDLNSETKYKHIRRILK